MQPVAGVTLASWTDRQPSSVLLRLLADPMIWALLGFAAGTYFFLRGFVFLQRKRFIQNIPRSAIRGASLGLVEVSGKVEGPYTIIAPLSEQDCFYYRTVAWQGGERRAWRKVAEENLSAPLFLDDGTGKVMVDPRGARRPTCHRRSQRSMRAQSLTVCGASSAAMGFRRDSLSSSRNTVSARTTCCSQWERSAKIPLAQSGRLTRNS
jgi:hypothetical protein